MAPRIFDRSSIHRRIHIYIHINTQRRERSQTDEHRRRRKTEGLNFPLHTIHNVYNNKLQVRYRDFKRIKRRRGSIGGKREEI